MRGFWVPQILRPDFTWPCPKQSKLSEDTPRTPCLSSRRKRQFWGLVHRLLERVSQLYCSWFDVPFTPPIMQLPFGLILKRSDRTRVEEVVAMQMARAAGMPVPLVLCYGELLSDTFRPLSILMTRLPGWPLNNSSDEFVADEEQPWFDELKECLYVMRQWKNPIQGRQVCSVIGTPISSQRVPNHMMGPFETMKQLHGYLVEPASAHGFKSAEGFKAALAEAKDIEKFSHRSTFTHGDLKAHNVLVDDNYSFSGFLDWETAGWYPEYWEFTTAMKYGAGTWWYQAMLMLGADRYMDELNAERALNNLTVDSWAG